MQKENVYSLGTVMEDETGIGYETKFTDTNLTLHI